MVVVLRDQDRRRPGAACVTRDSCHPSEHQTTFLGTPPRSCLVLSPSTPPTRRQPNVSLSQATEKRSPAAAKRCHPMSPSKTPRAARRGESDILSGLQSRSTMATMTTRKRMPLIWSASRPTHAVVPGATADRPRLDTPRGDLPEPCVPHQAQA
jgi:hypothetical protein